MIVIYIDKLRYPENLTAIGVVITTKSMFLCESRGSQDVVRRAIMYVVLYGDWTV